MTIVRLAPIPSSHLQIHLRRQSHDPFAHHSPSTNLLLHASLRLELDSAKTLSFGCCYVMLYVIIYISTPCNTPFRECPADHTKWQACLRPCPWPASQIPFAYSRPIPDLKSPLTCSIPSGKAHAPLWHTWRGYSPDHTEGSAVPYIAQGCPSQSVPSKLVTVATHNRELLRSSFSLPSTQSQQLCNC